MKIKLIGQIYIIYLKNKKENLYAGIFLDNFYLFVNAGELFYEIKKQSPFLRYQKTRIRILNILDLINNSRNQKINKLLRNLQ